MRTIVCAAVVFFASLPALAQEQVYRPGNGVTTPVPIEQPTPRYTPDALTARVEGSVTLECVVAADGTVSEGRVVRPLFPSLDQAALRTLSAWKFKPGTRDGKPVPVRVEIEMTFSLRDSSDQPRGPRVDSAEVFHASSKEATTPRLLTEVKPQYTAQAMRDRAQGTIRMDCVVLPDGTVGDVRINEGLHPELNREAVRTVRRWRFAPGTKDGVAVPVQVEIEMTFTLRDGPPKSPKEL
jgi:TonB family protein